MARPKLKPEHKRKDLSVTLPADVIDTLRAVGEGNVSRGIERVLKGYKRLVVLSDDTAKVQESFDHAVK